MEHLQLVIPGLFWSVARDAGVTRSLQLPNLGRIVGRGERSRVRPRGLARWLCQAFAIDKQHDWPVAPLTMLAEGGQPGNSFWLRADPVHLALGSAGLLLHPGLVLPPEDETPLRETVARCVREHGARFAAPRSGAWYIGVEQDPGISTTEPDTAAGQPIHTHLPAGPSAARWHSLCNELQMRLHEHVVNITREQRGLLAINSVWLWGGGQIPSNASAPVDGVWADIALARGLAALCEKPCQALPPDIGHELRRVDWRVGMMVVDDLVPAILQGDLDHWASSILEIERRWVEPLTRALARGHVKRLTLFAPGQSKTTKVEVARVDLCKFWRRTAIF